MSDTGASPNSFDANTQQSKLRKFYEREPEPPPEPAPSEPALVTFSSDTLEAGSWSATPKEPAKRGPGRPSKGRSKHTVGVYLTAEAEAIFREHAKELDISFSEWARRVLLREIEHSKRARAKVEG